MKSYILTQDKFKHKSGTTVYPYSRYDYGLAEEDTEMTGEHHISVCLSTDGSTPFFTVESEFLKEIK